ncbi:hypothetical protein J1N35_044455 [Gossypium stocksii]|uniref:Uncharacterized protein n=1 Tax=Gossypium stocksii TaxID=47602 RepID=A0A9D3U9J8_9ROSI|nr:hypothetical protein J1N35_044455 [Gossypium stocksii]
MSMMGDIKRQIGTRILSNTEDDHRREGNEHVKAIPLYSSKVLSGPKTLTHEGTKENTEHL